MFLEFQQGMIPEVFDFAPIFLCCQFLAFTIDIAAFRPVKGFMVLSYDLGEAS
jgi:hypothetical protein